MNTFATSYFIAVGLIVLAVWVLLYVDIVGPGLGRIGRRISALVMRYRSRQLRRAWRKWMQQRDRIEASTLPRTDRS